MLKFFSEMSGTPQSAYFPPLIAKGVQICFRHDWQLYKHCRHINIIICSIAFECPLDKSGCTTTGTWDVTQTLGIGLLKICLLLEVGVSLLISRNQLCLLAKKKAGSTCSLLLPHSFLGAASPSSSLRQEAVMSSGVLGDSHPPVFSSPH